MFKWVSIILIFTTSASFGFYKSYEIRQRKEILSDFQDMMERMVTEIAYFKSPLPVIISQMISSENRLSNQLLRNCYGQYAYSEQRKDFLEIWKTAVDETYQMQPVKTDDLSVFYRFGSILGQSSYDAQKGHFELIEKELSRRLDDAEAEYKTTGNLYRKAGVSVGAVLAVAFL